MLATLALLTALARDPSKALLDTGLACAEQLNYGCALQNLEAFRTAHRVSPTVTAPEAVKGCNALATVYASVDRGDDAKAAFEWCLELDPRFSVDPDVVGPRITPHYAAARVRFLSKRLRLEPVGPELPPLHEVPPAVEPVLHTPSEVLLSGSLGIGGGDAPNRLSMGAGGAVLFADDAESFSAGFGLEVDYARRVGPVAVVVDIHFSNHRTKRDDIRPGYPSTLYSIGGGVGVDWAWLAAERLEIVLGGILGVSAAGVGGLDDRVGAWLGLRAGLMVRVSDEFAAGFLAEPGLVIAQLESGEIGYSTVLPLIARFEARF